MRENVILFQKGALRVEAKVVGIILEMGNRSSFALSEGKQNREESSGRIAADPTGIRVEYVESETAEQSSLTKCTVQLHMYHTSFMEYLVDNP